MVIIKDRLRNLNTLRNQILSVYLVVMLFVLAIVSFFVYNQVSALVKNKAEKQMKQTAIEANGRMETLYKQVDTLSIQLVTNETVQQLLLSMANGNSLSFSEKQTLARMIRNYQVYSNGIQSFELYSADGNRIFPFDDTKLSDRMNRKWIEKADIYRGKAVWAGKDPLNGNYSLSIRSVSLMDRGFTKGGYLVTRIYNSYFQINDIDYGDEHREFMMLLDQNLTPITSNYKGSLEGVLEEGKQSVKINGTEYMVVKERSELTGWTLVILMPMSLLIEGVSAVRATILLSGGIGWVIFLISSFFLSNVITRPIHKLTSTMKNAKLDELKQSPEMFSSVEIIELNHTYNRMAEDINHLIQEVYEKELLRSRTELKALQSQINPHFLYNTLNALYWSLEERGEEDLAEHVVAMSNLFRYTIGNSKEYAEWVRIRDEMEHIERYLQLMKMRLGDRIIWEISAEPQHLECRIPKLTIQPLVENAIVHGIENKTQQGMIAIKTMDAETPGHIKIVVTDNGKGIDQQTLERINQAIKSDGMPSFNGKGIALSNVNKRLHLYYEEFDLPDLRVESTPGVGTSVTIEIPATGGLKDDCQDDFNCG